MIEFGLTGGIGSGKSTVAEGLVSRGAHLIDADQVVRDVQQPGSPVLEAIAERFGAHVLAADGALDRQAVADIVFADPDELKALNDIVHPAVGEEMKRQREAFEGTDAVVVLDIPLLVNAEGDTSRHGAFAGIIVVDVDPEVAVARLVEHRGFSEEDARNRIANQVEREVRVAKADFVVDNGGTLDALEANIDTCWAWMQTLADGSV